MPLRPNTDRRELRAAMCVGTSDDALIGLRRCCVTERAPEHIVLERLAAGSDGPTCALTMLGRIAMTIYILRYRRTRRSMGSAR